MIRAAILAIFVAFLAHAIPARVAQSCANGESAGARALSEGYLLGPVQAAELFAPERISVDDGLGALRDYIAGFPQRVSGWNILDVAWAARGKRAACPL